MFKNKKLFLNIATVIFLLSFLTTAVYAWFHLGDEVNDIKYQIMKIDSIVQAYVADDINSNGIPNLLKTPLPANEKSYYDERFSFTKLGEEKFALSVENSTTNVLDPITFSNVMPSKVFTLKYSLVNRSSVENRIKFKIQNEENLLNADLLSTLSLKIGYIEHNVDKVTQKITFGEKLYLSEYLNDTQKVATQGTDIKMPVIDGNMDLFISGMTFTSDGDNCGDFWLQIEMEPYEELMKQDSFKARNMDMVAYNALQNKSVTLPSVYIYFEVFS